MTEFKRIDIFPNTTVLCLDCDCQIQGGTHFNVDEAVKFHALAHAQGLILKESVS